MISSPVLEEKSTQPATAANINEEPPAPAIGSTDKEGKRSSSLPIMIAAGFLLLIIGGAAWYFSILPTNEFSEDSCH
ncbi:MAG: hypothetical protein U5J63_09895 [Fodinibius sp.]|nr:hypothetical protein [Fodinibius sp.]